MDSAIYISVFKCVASCVDPTACETLNDVDFDRIYTLAKKHNIEGFIDAAMQHVAWNVSDDFKQKLEKRRKLLTASYVAQTDALETLKSAFQNAAIEFMPLKGSILRNLYPDPSLRANGDIDILFHAQQETAVKKVMQDNGFSLKAESEKDITFFRPPFVFIEMHKSLTVSSQVYHIQSDPWENAVNDPQFSCCKQMSLEDLYVHMIVHLANHIRRNGIGLKHFIDIWLLTRQYKERILHSKQIHSQLEGLSLLAFEKKVRDLCTCWFEAFEIPDQFAYFTDYIFSLGVFGTVESKTAQKMQSRSKTALLLKRIFPSYQQMKTYYHRLSNPVFLPVFWVIRWGRGFSGKNRKRVLHEMQAYTKNQYQKEEVYQMLKEVGLSNIKK